MKNGKTQNSLPKCPKTEVKQPFHGQDYAHLKGSLSLRTVSVDGTFSKMYKLQKKN